QPLLQRAQPAHMAHADHEANPDPQTLSPAVAAHTARLGTAPGPRFANNDFVTENTSIVANNATCPGCALPRMNPSAASDGKNLFMVGNAFAAKSTTNGASWSYEDPNTLFSGSPVDLFAQSLLCEPSRAASSGCWWRAVSSRRW